MTSDIITRLSKLEAPDREVDAILWCLDNKLTFKKKLRHTYNGQPRFYSFRTAEKGTVGIGLVPKYTASVDAAIALAERVLPGHRWSAGFSSHVPHNAQIWVPSGCGYYEGESDANKAIALCIAILRAKEASHDTR